MEKKKATKIVLSVLSIGLVISALVSSTYALFSVDSYGAQPNDYTTGMLSIEAVSKSDTISLTNALPMTDEEGVETTPYVFSVKNIGNLDYQFDIELLSTGDASNTFPSNIIRLQIDDGEVTTLAEIGGKIKDDVILLAGESMDVSIRIWLSKDDTTNDHLGMSFNSKIVTNGQAIYTSSNSEYKSTFVDYLTNLYMSANPAQTTVANNGINYYYAPSVNMMNDGMGSNHTWEDGVNVGNIRYYGSNPNNYIDIGDRDDSGNVIPWRIIGVFKNMKLADGSTDTLVKVIRDVSLSNSMSWGSSDWSNTTIKTYLNDEEYYTVLSQIVKDKIAKVEWNLGGSSNSNVYSNDIYFHERGEEKCTTCTYDTIWEGNIALMYPSDFGYATDLTSCSNTLRYYESDQINCLGKNWLFENSFQSLLTPDLSSNYAWRVWSNGRVSNFDGPSTLNIRPTLYLKSSLFYDSGDGLSVESAYVLK